MMQSSYSDNCLCHYNIKILNLLDPELQLINTKPIFKNKLKESLSELKKFQVLSILLLEYKKKNNHKIFHSKAKVIANDSDINEAYKSMHQSIMKNSPSEDWFVETIVNISIKLFSVIISRNNSIEKCR